MTSDGRFMARCGSSPAASTMTATGGTAASLRCEAWGAVDFLWQDFVAAKRWPGDRIPATAHRSTWEGSRDEDGT
jgi:hypothetical protein